MMDKKTYEQIIQNEIQKAMDTMFPHGAGRATHTHVKHWLDTISKISFGQGEMYALMSLLTVEDVAEKFGISSRRVRAIARHRHERFGIGWQVPGTNQWLFRPEEIEILQPDEKYRRKASAGRAARAERSRIVTAMDEVKQISPVIARGIRLMVRNGKTPHDIGHNVAHYYPDQGAAFYRLVERAAEEELSDFTIEEKLGKQ